MIVKNNYKNALVYIEGGKKYKTDIKKGFIIAIPRRYHQLSWSIDWKELKNKTLKNSRPIGINNIKMKDKQCIVYIKDIDNASIVLIPSRLNKAKVFTVNNMDNFNKLMYFYCSKLSK